MKTDQDLAKEAKDTYFALKRLFEIYEESIYRQGEYLYKLKKDKLYRYVFGDTDQSWNSFCAEIGIPVSTVDYRVLLYERYVIDCGFKIEELVGHSTKKLSRALPVIKNKRDANRVIALADSLSESDFLKEIGLSKDHLHEPSNKDVKICKICKKIMS